MMRSPASLTRRSFLPAGILLLALVLFGTPRSSGQDFRRIVEIVGDMEDSLNIRIRNETELRRHETEQLRSDIVQLRSALEEARRSAAAHDSLLQKALVKPAAAPASAYPTAKVGVLSQFQISGLQEKTTAAQDANPNYHPHWSRQMTLRRMRILVGANLSASTSLFFESDTPLLGQVAASGAKDVKLAMNIQDAYVQQTIVPEFSILAGLQLVGITRNSLQSAATLMPVNYGAYAFATASALDTYTGRDLGIAVRGFLFDERFEYRAGTFSGRNLSTYTSPRYVVRFNYNLLDREKGFFYTGTTLGKGQIAAIGGGADLQGTYSAYALDGFYDAPLFDLGSVTASASYAHFDGGGSNQDSTYFTGTIPRQDVLSLEVGYLFKDWNIQPVVKYESQTVDADVLKQVAASTPDARTVQNKLRSGSRIGAGINYFLSGHGLSCKLMYEHVYRNRLNVSGQVQSVNSAEMVMQVQFFIF